MTQQTVSILTTVYNREKYLSECIESVLASTFIDWEMIIVDDCSTDNSLTIARHYEKRDNRIKVHVNERNLGDYPNRNKAASLASGKYIKYLDADDIIYPHSLEIMIDAMEKFPNAALGLTQEVFEDYLPYPFLVTPHDVYVRQFLKKGILDLGPTGTIIRKDCFENIGRFSGKRYIGDSELWLKLAANYPIVKMQSGLIFWRRHEGQEFQLGHKVNDYTILDYLVKNNALANTNCPLNNKEIELAKRNINFRHGRTILRLLIIEGKVKRSFEIMKATNFSIFNLLKCFLSKNIYNKL